MPYSEVRVGPFNAYIAAGALFLDYNGMPLFKGGVVQAFYSDSRQDDYGSGERQPSITMAPLTDGGVAFTFAYSDAGAAGKFRAEQVTSVHSDGRLEFRIEATWNGARPAMLEWNPVRLWAYPLVGGSFAALTEAGETVGHIGRRPPGSDYPASSLSSPWTHLSIVSRSIGKLTFDIGADKPLTALDAREDRFLRDLKVIWIGDSEMVMQPGAVLNRTLSCSFTPSSADSAPLFADSKQHLNVETKYLTHSLDPEIAEFDNAASLVVIPQPKRATYSELPVFLPSRFNLYTSSAAQADGALTAACAEWLSELKHTVSVSGAVTPERSPGANGIHIHIDPNLSHSASSGGINRMPAGGYRLTTSATTVTITGVDDIGAFYGLQTLRQLLRRNGRHWCFVGADIVDWPSLPFRGAHIFVGKNALPVHSKLIKNIISRFKLNELIIECEYTKWNSHPELWRDNSMDPQDLRSVADLAKACFIEPIPLINTLGHAEWIFKNDVHLDLAEDIASPHNYDPSNPDTYRLVFDVFSEALDIFGGPRRFHIGHDEVKVPSYDHVGKYPARPANISKGAGTLFLEDTNRLANWLRDHGAQTMMWGDMLLNSADGASSAGSSGMTAAYAPTPAEARYRRTAIPEDALVCDWRYEPGSEQHNGLNLFEAAGHSAIACAWFQPENIRGWAKQAVAANALGTLQTTWAGYDINESTLETDFNQFSAYVLAAEHAWNGGSAPESGDVKKQSMDASAAFRAAYRGAEHGTHPGWYLSLRLAANINLFSQGDSGPAWSAYPSDLREPSADTVDVPASSAIVRACDGVNLQMLGEHPGGIMLHGAANPSSLPIGYGHAVEIRYPAAARLTIDNEARDLCFLQATGCPVDVGTQVATYTINYADGSTTDVPIRYGYETRSLDDVADTGFMASPVRLAGGSESILRMFRWTNPKPRVRIASIDFRTDSAYAAPALFGLTGIQ